MGLYKWEGTIYTNINLTKEGIFSKQFRLTNKRETRCDSGATTIAVFGMSPISRRTYCL